MTTHQTWIDRLSDYLDGELAPGARAAVEAHVGECAECAHTLDELRRVVRRATALDDRRPATDLWPGIAERIGASVPPPLPADTPGVRPLLRRRVTLTVSQLMAAGLATLLVAGGGLWYGRAAPAERAGLTAPPIVATIAVATKYDAAVADLARVLETERQRLDPQTVRAIEESLAVIDRAIAQAQQALRTDPESDYLRRHLELTTQQKLTLLRRVTSLASAS